MTELGIIGRATPVVVSPAGALEALGGGMELDWWVGAEDRWHKASEAVAIRQQLADGPDAGAIETRMRVPGGDIVQRIGMVPVGGSAAALIDIVNETPVPVAVALVLSNVPGPVTVYDDTVSVAEASDVEPAGEQARRGRTLLRAGRPVSRVLSDADPAALAAAVDEGAAIPPAELVEPLPGGNVAVIYPLPHTATLRAVVSLAADTALPVPADLPSIADAERGWNRHLDDGLRIQVPDERVGRVATTARRHLLVASGQPLGGPFWNDVDPWVPAVTAVALDAWGHHTVARELLVEVAAAAADVVEHRDAEVGAAIWAWSRLLHRSSDPELRAVLEAWVLDRVSDLLARGRGRRWGRDRRDDGRPWRALALATAPGLLTTFGHSALARDIVDAHDLLVHDAAADPLVRALGGAPVGGRASAGALLGLLAERVAAAGASLSSVAGAASPVGVLGGGSRPHDPASGALYLLALRRALVDEPEGPGGPVALFPEIEPAWFGAPLEVHGAPLVAGGSIDVAARWHGARPALLWACAAERDVELRAPLLDPGWTDGRAAADTLLAPTPGLEVEAAPESAVVLRGQERDLGDDSPASFG